MSKFFQVGLVLIYINLIPVATLQAMVLAGIHITEFPGILSMAGWLLFCCAASWVAPYFQLLSYSGAQTDLHTHGRVPEEEEKLHVAFQEVWERAQCGLPFRLFIRENMPAGAFAIGRHTIIVSKTMLQWADPEELKGLLAHELGHLLSGDTFIFNSFMVASCIPKVAGRTYLVIKRWLSTAIGVMQGMGLVSRIVLVLVLGWLLHREHLIWPILVLFLFLFFFYFSEKLFRFFWLIISLNTEYKQDAFACRLGYGAGLRRALGRIAGEEIDPIIRNRIRRLGGITH
ncbi:MAG: M48 family metalloprotease [Bacteroidota bacterium]|nr:M48 family metalloprotease [Bacteroidota bacterium]MDP4215055.1 M48 family metalloprotease [Bacteroidota bacterium]MDP4244286.1 M48 family metalloprotease [Bacteroidota bacterium]MDP4252784.1 M48 family metalloprotease [Bacteroidota bacterium]MDP4257531.1 M48 family metalloprotease [Bacteroidota bacterium]